MLLVSLISTDAAAPANQLSAAAKLYVVPPSELVPFLFNNPPTFSWSAAFNVTVNCVLELTSTSLDVNV